MSTIHAITSPKTQVFKASVPVGAEVWTQLDQLTPKSLHKGMFSQSLADYVKTYKETQTFNVTC